MLCAMLLNRALYVSLLDVLNEYVQIAYFAHTSLGVVIDISDRLWHSNCLQTNNTNPNADKQV